MKVKVVTNEMHCYIVTRVAVCVYCVGMCVHTYVITYQGVGKIYKFQRFTKIYDHVFIVLCDIRKSSIRIKLQFEDEDLLKNLW